VFLGILAVTIGGAVLVGFADDGRVFSPSGWVTLGTVLLIFGGWAVSLCLHEFGHAITAYKGGDREVYFKGYLSLDPRRYTDPVFSLVFPLILLAIGGIPLPGGAVWINHHALRSRRTETLVSLAGPLMNLVSGLLLIVVVRIMDPAADGYQTPALAGALSFLGLLQIFAFLLNILPIPGLDGWGALEPYMPVEWQRFGAKARPWATLVLFAVLIGIRPIGQAFSDLAYNLYGGFGGDKALASLGHDLFFFWLR
jgi:Zn-dependent protease